MTAEPQDRNLAWRWYEEYKEEERALADLRAQYFTLKALVRDLIDNEERLEAQVAIASSLRARNRALAELKKLVK